MDGKVEYNVGEDGGSELNPKASVSMNYWGFHPSIFAEIEQGLRLYEGQCSRPLGRVLHSILLPILMTELWLRLFLLPILGLE